MNRPKIGLLVDDDEIEMYVQRMAREIDAHYRKLGAERVILVGVLNGAFIFLADLVRELERINSNEAPINWVVDFIGVGSQRSNGDGTMSSTREPIVYKDVVTNLKGEYVLVVEDVADTNRTLLKIVLHLQVREPMAINVAVLFQKPCAKVDLKMDFVGADVPNVYIVGYGLDSDGGLRGLPFVGEVQPETAGE